MDYLRPRHSSSAWGIHPRPISFIVHFLGLVAFVFVLIWTIYFRGGVNYNSSDSSHIFNVHPVMMLLSFVFLAGEAIMVYKTVPGSHDFRKVVHLSLQLVALVLAIVGICAAFKYHNLNSIDNLYSLHSWLGLVATILFGIQWLVAFVSFFFPGLAQSARASLLPWHVFTGFFIYGLIIVTAELGFLEKITFLQQSSTIGTFSSEAMFVNVLGLIVAVMACLVFIAGVIPDEVRPEGYSPIE